MSAYSGIQFCASRHQAPTIKTRVADDYVGNDMRLGTSEVTLNFTAEQYRELARACEQAAVAVEAQEVAA